MTALHILQTQGEPHARGMRNLRKTLLLGVLKWNVKMCLRMCLPVDDSLKGTFQIRLHPAEQTLHPAENRVVDCTPYAPLELSLNPEPGAGG